MRRLESSIERDLVLRLHQLGVELDINLIFIKLSALGRRGYPDRLLLWDGGHLMFVELKRDGERPRKLQVHVHDALRRMGFKVKVYDNADEALCELRAIIISSLKETAPH